MYNVHKFTNSGAVFCMSILLFSLNPLKNHISWGLYLQAPDDESTNAAAARDTATANTATYYTTATTTTTAANVGHATAECGPQV